VGEGSVSARGEVVGAAGLVRAAVAWWAESSSRRGASAGRVGRRRAEARSCCRWAARPGQRARDGRRRGGPRRRPVGAPTARSVAGAASPGGHGRPGVRRCAAAGSAAPSVRSAPVRRRRQVLRLGGEVLRDQRELEPDSVVFEGAGGEVLKPGLLGGADAVLGPGAGAVQALELDRARRRRRRARRGGARGAHQPVLGRARVRRSSGRAPGRDADRPRRLSLDEAVWLQRAIDLAPAGVARTSRQSALDAATTRPVPSEAGRRGLEDTARADVEHGSRIDRRVEPLGIPARNVALGLFAVMPARTGAEHDPDVEGAVNEQMRPVGARAGHDRAAERARCDAFEPGSSARPTSRRPVGPRTKARERSPPTCSLQPTCRASRPPSRPTRESRTARRPDRCSHRPRAARGQRWPVTGP